MKKVFNAKTHAELGEASSLLASETRNGAHALAYRWEGVWCFASRNELTGLARAGVEVVKVYTSEARIEPGSSPRCGE